MLTFSNLLLGTFLPNFFFLNSPQSLDIWQNAGGVISDFQISGQAFVKEICRNSRTSHDIDMKLGPLTKLDKSNTTTLKKNLTMTSCWKIVTSFSFFPIYGQFVTIQKPDSKCMVISSIVIRNRQSGNMGRLNRNLYVMLKFTERPKTPTITSKKHGFS